LNKFQEFIHRFARGRSARAAVFIDFENLSLALQSGSERTAPDLSGILDLAKTFAREGGVDPVRAYADWSYFAQQRSILDNEGVQTVQADAQPVHGKNSTDILMAVDMIDLMHREPSIGAFILVTGDSDFTPVAARLRQHRRRVVGVGVRGAVSKKLIEACDEFHLYTDLLSGEEAEAQPTSSEHQAEETLPPRAVPMQETVQKVSESKSVYQPDNFDSESSSSDPADLLGMKDGVKLPSARIRELLPRAAEAWRSIHPEHASEMRKALSMRHRGMISAQEAATLANLLRALGGYGAEPGASWLTIESLKDGELAYDILLAAARRTLGDDARSAAGGLTGIAEIITGEQHDSRELHMRMSRGDKALEAFQREHGQ
jgi:uncharacterized LabA/DUF88 family protein